MDAAARGRGLSAREEELLGLLAGFPDRNSEYSSDRELSFSDLVDAAGASSRPCVHHHAAAPAAREDHGGTLSPRKKETASRQQQAAARERRQRRQRSGGNRGSCGGGDGVLLNFYVPRLLTRSMTAPRPGRGALPQPGAVQAAPAKAAAVAPGKARTQGPLGIGCWPSLWGRRQAKACS